LAICITSMSNTTCASVPDVRDWPENRISVPVSRQQVCLPM